MRKGHFPWSAFKDQLGQVSHVSKQTSPASPEWCIAELVGLHSCDSPVAPSPGHVRGVGVTHTKQTPASAPVTTTAGCVCQHSVTCDDDQPSSVTQLPAWQEATPLTRLMTPTGHSRNSQENIVGLRKRKDCVLWQRSAGVATNYKKLKIENQISSMCFWQWGEAADTSSLFLFTGKKK